ncbi:hypothetical protein V1514DRAFT_330573 [Lipomyces japonicus]|uniref:uncharacterized protein n=1 Tax=Lipomyces japonicus TaxID=56871 RepID=UPI0034CF530C
MEKFSKWRDKGTGIAPFLPHPSSTFTPSTVGATPSPVRRLGVVILATISAIIKIPFVLLFGLLHFALLQHVPSISVRKTSLRLLLWSLGVWSINASVEGARKGYSRKTKQEPTSGDVIVSNFVSPLDALVYSTFYDSLIVIPSADGHAREVTLLGSIFAAISLPTVGSFGSESSIEKLLSKAKSSGKVLLAFVEATPTNGRAILPPALLSLDVNLGKSNVFPSLIRYSPQDITTPIPPSSIVVYVGRIISRFKGWSVRVRVAEPVASSDNQQIDNAINEICRIGRIKRVGEELAAKNKIDFVKAWRKSR